MYGDIDRQMLAEEIWLFRHHKPRKFTKAEVWDLAEAAPSLLTIERARIRGGRR